MAILMAIFKRGIGQSGNRGIGQSENKERGTGNAGESLKRGVLKSGNLKNGESLKRKILKWELKIFRIKRHCLLSWTNVSFIHHSKPNVPAIHF